MGAKHLDPWTGPFAVLETVGKSIVKCLNLETKRTVYIHLNDLRSYQRPDTREWKMNPLEIKRVCSELDIEFEEFEEGDLNKSWKNRDVLIDISAAADLEIVFSKALKELPRRILMVITEWRERKFFDVHSAIDAEDF